MTDDTFTTLGDRFAAALQSKDWRLDTDRVPPRLVHDDGTDSSLLLPVTYVKMRVGRGTTIEVPRDFMTRCDVPPPSKHQFDAAVRRHLGDAINDGWKTEFAPSGQMSLWPPSGSEAERWGCYPCKVGVGATTVTVPSYFTSCYPDKA
jgi:hypothetical protein